MSENPIVWVVAVFVGLIVFVVEEIIMGEFGHWALNAINGTSGPYPGLMAVCFMAVLIAGSVAELRKLLAKL